jgi:hypothetical protein
MPGYKRTTNKFYIEPRAGIGELGSKFSIDGYSSPSVPAFFSYT